ncbi:hypothetical protein [Raoultella sp. FYR_9]
MAQQSTAMPDPRYFQQLLPRNIRYDPKSGVYCLIAKRVNETHQQEDV